MCAKKTGSLENLAVVGVDLGKDTFHLVGFDRAGQLVMRKQIKRLALQSTFGHLDFYRLRLLNVCLTA